MSFNKIKNSLAAIKPYSESLLLIVSFINLVFFIILTLRANSLETDASHLQEQLVIIERNITNLQYDIHKITNFDTTIYGGEKFIYLESIHFQYFDNGSVNSVIIRGNLTTTINIVTPHYGRSEIIITNFTRYEMDIYRDGTEKYTDIKFVRKPNYLYSYQGLNTFKIDFPIAGYICPAKYLIPLPGQSTSPFIIGKIDFEIIFYDMQDLTNVTHGFNSEVLGIITIPNS